MFAAFVAVTFQQISMLKLFLAIGLLITGAASAGADPWADTLAKARGQTVYWNAWGGDATTNDFIAWVGRSVLDRCR